MVNPYIKPGIDLIQIPYLNQVILSWDSPIVRPEPTFIEDRAESADHRRL